jgi:FkbM family methyltransferase
MACIKKQQFPINAVLKNGEKKVLKNYYEAYLTSFEITNNYRIDGTIISIFKPNLSKINIDIGNNNGDIYAVFFEEIYQFLPVKDQVIVDIGANIGDSSIYFAIRGAKKVIALEPLPKNHSLAEKNIKNNNLENKIELFLSGCSNSNSHIFIDPQKEGAGTSINHSEQKLEVPLKTLKTILNENNFEPTLLKLDCEGCEYDIILSSSDETLKKFSHIQIEYHYGYKNLKRKLELCGFNVSVTEPNFIRNQQAGKNMFFGYIFAKRL